MPKTNNNERANSMQKYKNMKPLELAELACSTMMKKFEAEKLPPVGHFHYHQGVFLSGVEQTYLNTGKKEYADYIKKWVDSLIDENGSLICEYNENTLDDKQPAILMFRLLEKTGDIKYENAIRYIVSGIEDWPKTSQGGFYHMKHLKKQMWLDGLYMAGELLTRYGVMFGEERFFELVHLQAKLMWDNIRDERTGLLYHAWDESRTAEWADPKTGRAPHFWGRAAGWYIVALCTILKYMPADCKYRANLIDYVQKYIEAFAKYQDIETGLWYQVIDRGDDLRNWTETSCSALFLCGISMALKAGYIDGSYRAVADKAYTGLADAMEDDGKGGVIMPRICIGTGVGDYEFYLARPTSKNDLHGVGALLLACNAYHELCSFNKEA